MLHELRIYRAMPGKLAELHARFRADTLRILEKNGIRPIHFWTVMIGGTNQDIYWLVEWQSLAEREQKWAALGKDPEWARVKAESEKAGALIEYQTNVILEPTNYSPGRPA